MSGFAKPAIQMTRYVAFLRGINVGGRNIIKMEDLARAFLSLKFKCVRTYIQSGNVIFEAAETGPAALARKIEKKLQREFGHEIAIAILTKDELEQAVKGSPFLKIKPDDDSVMFVAFLAAEPARKPKLPFTIANGSLEVLAIKNRAAAILCHRKKNGLFEFPNNFVEKEFGVSATTRNWNTVNKIVALTKE